MPSAYPSLPSGRAQGYCHYGRSMAWYQYVDLYYGERGMQHNHSIVVVPNVGHDNCLLFQAPKVREKLFEVICQ